MANAAPKSPAVHSFINAQPKSDIIDIRRSRFNSGVTIVFTCSRNGSPCSVVEIRYNADFCELSLNTYGVCFGHEDAAFFTNFAAAMTDAGRWHAEILKLLV